MVDGWPMPSGPKRFSRCDVNFDNDDDGKITDDFDKTAWRMVF